MRRIELAVLVLLLAAPAYAQIGKYPLSRSMEAFGDRADTTEIRFQFYFPVDQRRYLPVDRDLAAILSFTPAIEAPRGLHARVVRSVCRPKAMVIEEGDYTIGAEGGEMVTEVELRPDAPNEVTDEMVKIRYPLLDAVVAKIDGISPGPAEVNLAVHIWPSVAARDETVRAEAERVRREREAREQARRAQAIADEKTRIAREKAEAEARKAARIRLLHQSIPFAIVLAVIGFVLFLYRHWISPDLILTATGGSHLQKSLPKGRSSDAEPGTILHTAWARDWMGFRKRIKVESFVADHAAAGEKKPGIDVLVSVGKSVPAGKYVAESVKIVVL